MLLHGVNALKRALLFLGWKPVENKYDGVNALKRALLFLVMLPVSSA